MDKRISTCVKLPARTGKSEGAVDGQSKAEGAVNGQSEAKGAVGGQSEVEGLTEGGLVAVGIEDRNSEEFT